MNSTVYLLLALALLVFVVAVLLSVNGENKDAKFSKDRIEALNLKVSELAGNVESLLGAIGDVQDRLAKKDAEIKMCIDDLADKYAVKVGEVEKEFNRINEQNGQLRMKMRSLESNLTKQSRTINLNLHGAVPVEFVPASPLPKKGLGRKALIKTMDQ